MTEDPRGPEEARHEDPRHEGTAPAPDVLWRSPPRRIMHMGPLVVSLGALLVFGLVVGFVVVLPLDTFQPGPSDNAVPLSDAAWRGKQNFQQQGCYLCHSSFTRPQDMAVGQYFTYTRVSEAGDWPGQDQTPNLFGTERTGPDLANEGGHHPDDWQRAHYADPRFTTPHSIMPSFVFWSDQRLSDAIAYNQFQGGKQGLLRYAAITVGDHLMLGNMAMSDLQTSEPGMVERAGERYQASGEPSDKSPSGLPWKAVWMLNSFARGYWLTDDPLPLTQQNLIRGKLIFQDRCVGCHGVKGDGQGPAASFLTPPPFDFTDEMAMSGPAASPGMMYHRILTAGPGTAMENFGTRLSVEDIWRTVLFLRTIPGGSLATPDTVPTVDMYRAWTPPPELLAYVADHPIGAADNGPSHEPDADPFLEAAHWVAPGMAQGDTILVGGKLPVTLASLRDAIHHTYETMIANAYDEAARRGGVGMTRAQALSTDHLVWQAP